MKQKGNQAYLKLQNGALFEGFTSNPVANVTGEVVFTTGMTGYLESLTDPSYAGQILTFTFPLIGNYGVADASYWESKKIHASAVIVSESAPHFSHYLAQSSLVSWLEKQNIPLFFGVDTRQLTKMLRASGTMVGTISSDAKTASLNFNEKQHLVSLVSILEKKMYGSGKKRIIAVDCGMKESMIRHLSSFPIEIERVPFDYDYSQEMFDGIFLSNGPGDPEMCVETIAVLKKAMRRQKPIFGVCLGSQLLGLAAGGKTIKLKFGHRGQNQPCIEVKSGKCFITSQNHGFAVDATSLPDDWEVTFRNLNDDSVEGIQHKTLPFFAVQFHPEAQPGPTDTRFLFERFYQCL